MAELRWILLLAGLVFLAALAAWEHLRPRQGRRDESARVVRSIRAQRAADGLDERCRR